MKRPGLFPGALILIGVGFGVMDLARVASNPRLEAVRAVDEMQLISVGVCFGMAIVGIILLVRNIVLHNRR